MHSPVPRTTQYNPVQPSTQIRHYSSILCNDVTPHLIQYGGKQWGTATAGQV